MDKVEFYGNREILRHISGLGAPLYRDVGAHLREQKDVPFEGGANVYDGWQRIHVNINESGRVGPRGLPGRLFWRHRLGAPV